MLKETQYILWGILGICTWNFGSFISLEVFEIFDVCLGMWLYTIFPFFQQILEWMMDDWNVWTLWNVCVFPLIVGVIG